MLRHYRTKVPYCQGRMNHRTTGAGESLTLALMARLEAAKVSGRMKDARIRTGLSQQDFADVLKVHKHTVENVENNRLIKGPYQYVNAWAAAANVAVEWILHGHAGSTVEEEAVGEEILAVVERIETRVERLEAELLERPAEAATREASDGPQ